MYKPVQKRITISCDAHGWDRNSFNHGRRIFKKDGYEVYFFHENDGFELNIRDPDDQTREQILEVRDENINTFSPLYVAILEHVLKNAEQICSKQQNKNHDN
jgi:hypothetical protein